MSLIRSLPSSLPRSLGAGSLVPAALPWEDAGGGTSQTALLMTLVRGLGGWWWDARRSDLITIATGVSVWTDSVQGFAVSQGTGGLQPAYANATVTGDGVNDTLKSATNPLNGATAYTMHLVGAHAGWGASVIVLWDSGAAAAARATSVLNGAAGHRARIENPGGTINAWDSGDTSMASGVYTFQADIGAGAAATTAVLRNGTSMGGSRTTSGAVSGALTTGAGIWLFSDVTGAANAAFAARSFVLLPTVSAANNTQVIPLLRGIYGV